VTPVDIDFDRIGNTVLICHDRGLPALVTAKYADNGRGKSERGLAEYFKTYRNHALLDLLKYSFEKKAEPIFRSHVTEESIAHRLAKNVYRLDKKSLC